MTVRKPINYSSRRIYHFPVVAPPETIYGLSQATELPMGILLWYPSGTRSYNVVAFRKNGSLNALKGRLFEM